MLSTCLVLRNLGFKENYINAHFDTCIAISKSYELNFITGLDMTETYTTQTQDRRLFP
jgi:hypothetical protein